MIAHVLHASDEVAFHPNSVLASSVVASACFDAWGHLNLLPAHTSLLFISYVRMDEIVLALSIAVLFATICTMLLKSNFDHVGVLAASPVVVPLIIAINMLLCVAICAILGALARLL